LPAICVNAVAASLFGCSDRASSRMSEHRRDKGRAVFAVGGAHGDVPDAFDLIVCSIFSRQKNSGPKAAIP